MDAALKKHPDATDGSVCVAKALRSLTQWLHTATALLTCTMYLALEIRPDSPRHFARAVSLLYNSIHTMNNIAQNTVNLIRLAYFYVILRIVHILFGI